MRFSATRSSARPHRTARSARSARRPQRHVRALSVVAQFERNARTRARRGTRFEAMFNAPFMSLDAHACPGRREVALGAPPPARPRQPPARRHGAAASRTPRRHTPGCAIPAFVDLDSALSTQEFDAIKAVSFDPSARCFTHGIPDRVFGGFAARRLELGSLGRNLFSRPTSPRRRAAPFGALVQAMSRAAARAGPGHGRVPALSGRHRGIAQECAASSPAATSPRCARCRRAATCGRASPSPGT